MQSIIKLVSEYLNELRNNEGSKDNENDNVYYSFYYC